MEQQRPTWRAHHGIGSKISFPSPNSVGDEYEIARAPSWGRSGAARLTPGWGKKAIIKDCKNVRTR